MRYWVVLAIILAMPVVAAQASLSTSVIQVGPQQELIIAVSPEMKLEAIRASLETLQSQGIVSDYSIQDAERIRVRMGDVLPGSRMIVQRNGLHVDEAFNSYIVEFVEPEATEADTQLEYQATSEVNAMPDGEAGTQVNARSIEMRPQEKRPQEAKDNHRAALADLASVLSGQEMKIQATSQASSQAQPLNPKASFHKVLNGVALELTPQQAAKARESRYVKNVWPDRRVRVTMQGALPQISALPIWNIDADGNDCSISGKPCMRGQNVTIAIIDTGVDYTHPDLGGCTRNTFVAGNCTKVRKGYDFVNGDNDPADDHGHGTHVAGIAAGKGDTNSNGIYEPASGDYWGVAPEATIYAYKVLDSSGSGYYSSIIQGIERAVQDNASIISMSLGGSGDPDDAMSLAVDNAVRAGVLVVVAAGNSGPYEQSVNSPGVARLALTVAAVDNASKIAYFSSRGPVVWSGGTLLKPDIAAPGVNICAAQYSNYSSDRACGDTEHIAISGTSMATPVVSGAAALLHQARPNLNATDKRAILMSTANDLGISSIAQGHGLVNASAAVNAAIVVTGDLAFGTMSAANTGNKSFTIRNVRSTPVSVTLAASNVTAKNGVSSSALTLNSTALTLAAGETATVAAQLDVASLAEGIYSGSVTATVDGRSYRLLYSFSKFSTLTVVVEGQHYLDIFVHDAAFEETHYTYDLGGMNPQETFALPAGNYTVYAINAFVMPSRPDLYPDPDAYFLYDAVTVNPNSVTQKRLRLSDARVFTPVARSPEDKSLTMTSSSMDIVSYQGALGYCERFHFLQSSCENSSDQHNCLYSDDGYCLDRAFKTSFSISGYDPIYPIAISPKPAGVQSTDFIWRLGGYESRG